MGNLERRYELIYLQGSNRGIDIENRLKDTDGVGGEERVRCKERVHGNLHYHMLNREPMGIYYVTRNSNGGSVST